MEPIFSMTTLQRNPSQVKEAARDSVVRITEQGAGAYVFCSEEEFTPPSRRASARPLVAASPTSRRGAMRRASRVRLRELTS